LPPIEEQRRIAAILDHADELVRMRLAALGRADLLLQVLIQESLAASESQVPLKELADIRIGPFGSLLHREDYVEGGVPLINPMHIVAGALAADPATQSPTTRLPSLRGIGCGRGTSLWGAGARWVDALGCCVLTTVIFAAQGLSSFDHFPSALGPRTCSACCLLQGRCDLWSRELLE
jgi:hypothetical protein